MTGAVPIRTRWLRALALCAGLVLLIGTTVYLPPASAQPATPKPFILPFKDPPGPDTWLMAQPYGNTTGAYRRRDTIYRLGQGIHFGVDFSARCGTEIVAIADGVVFAADNLNFGSEPHNLMIDHPDLGYASLYGHLLQRPEPAIGRLRASRATAARTCIWSSATRAIPDSITR